VKISYVGNISNDIITGPHVYQDIVIRYMGERHDVRILSPDDDIEENITTTDIVHFLDIFWARKRLIERVKNFRIPVVIDVHDYYWTEFYPYRSPDLPLRLARQQFMKRRNLELLALADAVVTHCNYVKNKIPHPRVANVSVYVISDNMRTPKPFRERRDEILFVGRNFFRKGLHTLLRAMPIVLKECPSAKLLVVGQERLHTLLAARWLARGLPVSFLGGLSSRDTLKLYGKVKVFVLPSEIEASPVSPLEAIACGTPVVCSAVGGIPELIEHGVTGMLCRPGDYHTLAQYIVRCLQDEIFSMQLVENGQAALQERFAVELMIERIEQVYQGVMSR